MTDSVLFFDKFFACNNKEVGNRFLKEMKTIHHHFHNGLTTMLDKITQVMSVKTSWTLEEMYKASDILKDLSEVEKNVEKCKIMSEEHSDETF